MESDASRLWYMDSVSWRNRPEEISPRQVSLHAGSIVGERHDPRGCRIFVNASSGPVQVISKWIFGVRDSVEAIFEGCQYGLRPIDQVSHSVSYYNVTRHEYPVVQTKFGRSLDVSREKAFSEIAQQRPAPAIEDFVVVDLCLQPKQNPADTVFASVGDSNQFIPFNEIPYSPSLVQTCGIIKTFGWVMRHDVATRLRQYLGEDFFYWKRI